MSAVRKEVLAIVKLAVPVVVTQLGAMMLWVVDYIMIGAVGVEELGAVSLGRLWVLGTLTFSMGVVFGIDPLLTQAHGARNPRLLSLTLQRGIVISLLAALPIAALWLLTEEVLVLTGQDLGLSAMAGEYVLVQVPLIPLFLLFTLLRQYLLARGIVLPSMWVIFLGNGVNILANWALIYGHWGLPVLGVTGVGIATTLTQACMLAVLAGWIVLGRLYRDAWTGWSRSAFKPAELLRIYRYGWPVGLQLILEMWAFMSTTLLAGWMGAVPLASHTIVLNLASISFMVPLGISFGAVARVGNLIGAGDPQGAQRAAWVALCLGGGVMCVSAAVFVGGRYWLPIFYTGDSEVIALAATLLPIAAAFQLFDGIQVVGGGVLRGMGKTRPVAIFNLLGYYALALPLAYWLALPRGLGLAGLWWGLCLGLAAVAACLVIWVAYRGPAGVDARIVDP